MYLILVIFIMSMGIYANKLDDRTINVVLGIDKPPFIFGKSSKKGIEPDIMKEGLEAVGYRVKIVQKPKKYMQKVLHEKNDIDAVATISPQKDELFYSDTITSYENYVITKKGSHIGIDSIDDLTSIKFVSWSGAYNDLGEKFYNYFNPINGIYKKSYNDNLSQKDDIEMFFSGKVDAIIIDKTIFHWYKVHFDNHDKYVFHNIFKKKKEYPATFKSKKLRDDFNIGLQKLKKSGRFDEIIKFYEFQDMEELLNLTKLIAAISNKYLFEHEPERLEKILSKFFIHPDITSILVEDKQSKAYFLTLINNDGILTNDISYLDEESSKIETDILHSELRDILPIGRVHIRYKKNYRSDNGILFPPLKNFNDLPEEDISYIQKMYEKIKSKNRSKILLTKAQKEYLEKHQTITVHNENKWAPYNFTENDIPKGLVIDYIDLLAKKLKINIRYISGYSWSEFMDMVKAEKIDVISNIAISKEREKYVNFTKPYMQSKKAIFSNTPNLNNLSDLNGKTVAVPNQFFTHSYLKKHYPKIKLKTYKNTQECLYAIINKEADALVENYAVVNYLIRKNGLKIKYVSINEDKELMTNISIGVRKSQTILRDILQKAQNSVTRREFDELEDRWFGLHSTNSEIFTTTQKRYLKRKKSIRICTNPRWAPIEFVKDGKPMGITIDTIGAITSKIGLKPDYIKTSSWKESQEYLRDRKCDILASAIKTEARKKYAAFTKPYLTYNLAIITKNDKPLIDNIAYIIDKPMVRREASGISMILKESYPNIMIQDKKNMNEAFKSVQKGESYFSISTLPVFAYNKKISNFNDLQISGYSKLKCKLSIAVRNDDKILLSIMDKILEKIPADTIKIINDKWTTQDVIKKPDYTLAWTILLIAIFIIIVISLSHKKQVILKKRIEVLNQSLEQKVEIEISKNQEKEKLMLQQSRLAQMGEIISMIAHQWRQPLNTLSMLNQSIILKHSYKKIDDDFMEYFKNNSQKQINNMSTTIDDFRSFFKPEREKVEFSINSTIENTIDMVAPVFKNSEIELLFRYEESLYAKGYPNELGQAILNIINNAKDALIDNDEIVNKKISIELKEIENNILIIISDNAGGINNKVIDKIFDPYFSTKEQKNGTGLGLYMCKIIIEEHMNGTISISNDESGAVFEIRLKSINYS